MDFGTLDPEFGRALAEAFRAKCRDARPCVLERCVICAFERLTSTMDVARAIATSPERLVDYSPRPVSEAALSSMGGDSRIVVVAREQSAGRGRAGRKWESGRNRGIFATFVLPCSRGVDEVSGFPLAVGVAALRVFQRFGVHAGLKWPNDIWVLGQEGEPEGKLCGILVERTAGTNAPVTAGVGVNLTQPAMADDFPAAALCVAAKRDLDYGEVLAELAAEVFSCGDEFDRSGLAPFLAECRDCSILSGKRVSIVSGNEEYAADVLGIAPNGALLIQRDGMQVELYSGDVHVTSWRRGGLWA